MKRLFLVIGGILTMLLVACKCDDVTENSYPIYIDNKSGFVISSYLALGGDNGIVYPDTSLVFDKAWIGYDTKPGDRAYLSLPLLTIREWISSLPQDTLSIFIFSKDTLDKYDWSEVQSSYKILQRYDLSSEDFKRLSDKNGVPVITYPPTEVMRNMKMYPPYDGESRRGGFINPSSQLLQGFAIRKLEINYCRIKNPYSKKSGIANPT